MRAAPETKYIDQSDLKFSIIRKNVNFPFNLIQRNLINYTFNKN